MIALPPRVVIAAKDPTIRAECGRLLRLCSSLDDRGPAAFSAPRLLATYLHLHLAARPDIAERFVAACGPPRGRTP